MSKYKDTNRKRLARQIAALLANPACPAELHNAITDELTFYRDLLDFERAEVVEMSLRAFEESREVETGEAGGENPLAVIG
ncbi:MAG TPA: hypothetical protein VF604_18075 [Pyrinomonadaceae bacterium]|jgi:hypothetical protein